MSTLESLSFKLSVLPMEIADRRNTFVPRSALARSLHSRATPDPRWRTCHTALDSKEVFSCKIVELHSVAIVVMMDAAYAENRPNGPQWEVPPA
jgi:hypothetical protein